MGLNNGFYQDQAKPRTFGFFGTATAVETLENFLNFLWIDTATTVFNANLHQTSLLLRHNAHLTLRMIVLECLLQQIGKGLNQSFLIPPDLESCVYLRDHFNLPLSGQRLDRQAGLVETVAQINNRESVGTDSSTCKRPVKISTSDQRTWSTESSTILRTSR